MVALETLVLAAALSAAGETVLLQFSSQYCGPCKTMAPVVKRLAGDGYPVRLVDVDRERELAAQYKVTGVPCFVMVANGREVDRVTGATSYDRLTQLFQAARVQPPGSAGETVRGQSPDALTGGPMPDLLQKLSNRESTRARERSVEGPPADIRPTTYDEDEPAPAPAPARGDARGNPQERAMQATVKLTIDEGKFTSHGTGTIIDTHGDEALVLTCGHVFRDCKGKGAVRVTFCANEAAAPIPGTVIAFDLKRDVALVSIRPTSPVTAMQVAPPSFRPQRGGKVFSIGCDHGREARLVQSNIAAIDKYTGPSNLEVAGAPAEGRSGGGLFTEEGFLIGVCNAADPADNEGIYAALPSVYWQLAQIGQQAIFERAEMDLARERAAQPLHDDAVARDEMAAPPGMANEMPPRKPGASVASATAPAVANPFQDDDTEVICIIRSRKNPQARSETIVLDRPSPEFLNRLSQEYQNPALSGPRQAARPATKGVFRAQSVDR